MTMRLLVGLLSRSMTAPTRLAYSSCQGWLKAVRMVPSGIRMFWPSLVPNMITTTSGSTLGSTSWARCSGQLK